MLYNNTIIFIIEILLATIPTLITVAFVTLAERETMASMQRRLGPNVVGYYGLLQAFADGLKLIIKEYVSPTQANLVLFFLGPIITLIFSLSGYAVVPYGPGMAIWDFHLDTLYMLAVSCLVTYGILLAGWSLNSKYGDLFAFAKIILTAEGICLSMSNLSRPIITSTLLKSIVYLLSIFLGYCGVPVNITLNIISVIFLFLLVVGYYISNNKTKLIFNLIIIYVFWSILSVFIPLLDESFLVIFLINYGSQDLNSADLGLPADLQNLSDSVFSHLNSKLTPIGNGGPNNGGPNVNLNNMFMNDDDKDNERIRADIREYYSKKTHTLNNRSNELLAIKDLLIEYNKLVYSGSDISSNSVNIEQNVLSFDSKLFSKLVTHYPHLSSVDNYNDMVALYNLYLWENSILDKAKFFCENHKKPEAFSSLVHLFSCKSDYNYWINRQVDDTNILRVISNHWRIINFTNLSDFYLEVCNDAIWVKLHLLLYKSFIEYDIALESKIKDYNSIIVYIAKLHSINYEQAYLCADRLSDLRIRNMDPSLLEFVYLHTGHKHLTSWDHQYTPDKLGLGTAHKYAYPYIDYHTRHEHFTCWDYQRSPGKLGLGTVHKSAYPYLDYKDFYNKHFS